MTIQLVTLGCSKNLVDSERILRQFNAHGFQVYHRDHPGPSDIIILNTCGFILDAKQESVEAILVALDLKTRGLVKKVLVMGCLSERYKEELKLEMPEVDGFFGVWDQRAVIESVGGAFYPDQINDRYISTPSHYAFLKISEGCDRSCSFCSIPSIRGPQQSRRVEDLLEETQLLADKGVKELILIAQDLTSYGTDLYNKKSLASLVRRLLSVEKIEWIRLHYAYPTGFPGEVIQLMADEPRICNYIDIPIQHINNQILRFMNRGHTRKRLEELLLRFREQVPGVAIRTTVMTGFPGETEEEFNELLGFVRQFRFERLGVFTYSHEEQTTAYRMKDDIPASEKERRAALIMEVQQDISYAINSSRVGEVFKVLIDKDEGGILTGRTEYDSPEVDNEVIISNNENSKEVGNFCKVRITGADQFELRGELI